MGNISQVLRPKKGRFAVFRITPKFKDFTVWMITYRYPVKRRIMTG